ncbi:hypothetical protein HDV01_004521 [Terramyces sp. JEL0728]|nr:hypothetical protein HDV01_004521 [Terramyces sp. JEL0728]
MTDGSKEKENHDPHADVIDEEVLKLIQTDPKHGLTDAEVEERLAKWGRNGNDQCNVRIA